MEKKQRAILLKNFTKYLNTFNELLDDESPTTLVSPQFEKLKGCLEKLEDAQDAFLAVTEIDIETDKDGLSFIDEHNDKFKAAMKRYSTHLKTSNAVDQEQLQRKTEDDRQNEAELRKQIALEKKEADDLLQKEELVTKFNSQKAEFTSAVDAFSRLSLRWKESVAESPDSVKVVEWGKLCSKAQAAV